MAKTAQRRHERLRHGMRRLKDDRMGHGEDKTCACFDADAGKGKGAVFARFADTPASCSCWMCRNRYEKDRPQVQRAPTVRDWD